MTNIPTELLRTLVTVVELRSFTKAAHSLGMTQPAVSAQIKRLQVLLGGELLDKSAPGVALTPKGEAVIHHARELLHVNDQIVEMAIPGSPSGLRIGISDEAQGAMLPSVLAACRRSSTEALEIRRSDDPLRDLRQGELDLAIALGETAATPEPRHRWTEPLAWVSARGLAFAPNAPLPLVLADAAAEITRLATAALDRNGTQWQAACRVPSSLGCSAAIAAGLGVGAMLRRFVPAELAVCEDPRLPRLPQRTCAIHVRDAPGKERVEPVADALAETLRPTIAAPSAVPPDVEEPATQLQPEH